MDTTVLEDLGLSHAEARLYLTLLEEGPSTTGPLIDATKLQSSTVYHVLGSLLEKGLVNYILKGKVKVFQAESPEEFLLFLDEKRARFQEILPLLKQKEVHREKQTARVFEGMKGLRAAMNDVLLTLKRGEEYYFFQVPTKEFQKEKVQRVFRRFHLDRDARGIRVKGLTLKENKKAMQAVHQGLRYSQLRFTSEILPLGLVIYKDKVITLDWEGPTAFVIQSSAVAESYTQFFKEKWKHATSR